MFLYAVGGWLSDGADARYTFSSSSSCFSNRSSVLYGHFVLISVASSVFIVDEIRQFAIRTRLKRKERSKEGVANGKIRDSPRR